MLANYRIVVPLEMKGVGKNACVALGVSVMFYFFNKKRDLKLVQ